MSERWTLFFDPIDVLLFRDARPFDPGVDIVAQSVFPSPSVFYGCIRTALLRLCGAEKHGFKPEGGLFQLERQDARTLLGGPEKPGKLAMRGPLLAWAPQMPGKSVNPLFPVPLDVTWTNVLKRQQGHVSDVKSFGTHADDPLRLRMYPSETRSIGEALPWTTVDAEKDGTRGYLTVEGMRAYFTAKGGKTLTWANHFVKSDCVMQEEVRVGIARNADTRTVEDKMFYIKKPYRFAEGVGFAVDVNVAEQHADLMDQLHGHIVPLGGKGHRACIRVSKGALLPNDLDPAERGDRAGKLLLLTPLPLPLASDAPISTQVTSRGILLGGIDMAARAPKPLRRALPPGTVIHFDGTCDWKKAYASLFAEKNGTHVEPMETSDDWRMGFGTALGGPFAEPT